MKSKKLIAASLICGDPINLEKDLHEITNGGADLLHFDVMDGKFVPRHGLYVEILKRVKDLSNIPVDVHMMVDNPEEFITTFAEFKPEYYCFHIEATKHANRLLKQIKDSGMKAGIALNPATPLSALDWVINDVSLVCLMAINPGIVGHKLIPSSYDKIAALRKYASSRGNNELLIEVDGGVTFDTGNLMLQQGADVLVCGTGSIFRPQEDTISNKIKAFRATFQ